MRAVDRGIAAFLDGATNGEELLHALYDHILAEPIPQSMRGILQEPQRKALGNSRQTVLAIEQSSPGVWPPGDECPAPRSTEETRFVP